MRATTNQIRIGLSVLAKERPLVTVFAALVSLAPTQFLARPGGRVAFSDTGGEGALVVLVPGLGDLRGTFRFLEPALVARGMRVVTMDVRGHGQSSATFDDYSRAVD